ncbi:fumarate hydratase [candidate division WOR-3 bacterium]|nr:fumarate hydratase [candidate division WOR-3 bacterium]
MKVIEKGIIRDAVFDLCIKASTSLSPDVLDYYRKLKKNNDLSSELINLFLQNSQEADEEKRPVCQDTGVVCVFAEVGSKIFLSETDIKEEIDEGVRLAKERGFLRDSMLSDYFSENKAKRSSHPAEVYTEIVKGENISLTLLLKGGGSENSGRINMFLPQAEKEEIYDFVEKTVSERGINACPPLIIGIGTGGTTSRASFLSLIALTRDIGQRNRDSDIADMETDWLNRINALGIGPGGFGGFPTAIELFIETSPRHISTFPVSVSFQCCAARKAKTLI